MLLAAIHLLLFEFGQNRVAFVNRHPFRLQLVYFSLLLFFTIFCDYIFCSKNTILNISKMYASSGLLHYVTMRLICEVYEECSQ